MRWQTVAGWSLAAILASGAVVAISMAHIAVREDLKSSRGSSAEGTDEGDGVVISLT